MEDRLEGCGQSLTLPVRLVTVFGAAALVHTGTGRRVVQLLGQVLLRVLLLATVAAALPVEAWVPGPAHHTHRVSSQSQQSRLEL